MTPANAAIVRANPTLFAPLVRWLYRERLPRSLFECGCTACVVAAAEGVYIDPDRLVALNTTPDMLPEGGRDG